MHAAGAKFWGDFLTPRPGLPCTIQLAQGKGPVLPFGSITADSKQVTEGYISSSPLPTPSLCFSFSSDWLPGSFMDLHRKLLCLGGLGLRVASHIDPP